jgi:hypothetical protein
LVEFVVPSVRALNDAGYGEAAATVSGEIATLTASGFGQDATAAGPIVAHVGGLPAATEVTARDGRPGEFDVKVGLPAGWQSGDVISLRAGLRAANRTTVRKAARPEVNFVRLPSDAPELRTLAGSDLRGDYLVASGARDSAGCYPSYLFDSARNSMARIDSCLAGGNQGAIQGGLQPDFSPVTAESEGAGLAALVGPAEGQAPAGVSSKVLLFHRHVPRILSHVLNHQIGESGFVDSRVEREQAEPVHSGMRPNDEVGENAFWAGFASPLAARRISLEGSPGGAPDPLIEIPIHPDVRVPKELIEKGDVTAGSCHQFGEHRRSRNQWTAL